MQHQKRFQNNIAHKCGISADKALLLVKAGYAHLDDLREASDEELLAVEASGRAPRRRSARPSGEVNDGDIAAPLLRGSDSRLDR